MVSVLAYIFEEIENKVIDRDHMEDRRAETYVFLWKAVWYDIITNRGCMDLLQFFQRMGKLSDMKKIMIVDDDRHINEMLNERLSEEGYEVIAAYSGTEAQLLLAGIKPDLILLDLMLPGLSGEELIQQIKGIPVIVLSAKADIADKVGLLRGGAADYMTKPFEMEELLARIDVQLRRTGTAPDSNVLNFHDISLDQDTHLVKCNGNEIRLTRTEYAILRLLMLKPAQVVAKLTILESISDDTPDCTEDSLKIHIHNLRRKLKAATGKDHISAVWGIGFMLVDGS